MDKEQFVHRLERITNLQDTVAEVLDVLPVKLPGGTKQKLMDWILQDEKIDEMLSGIKKRRPPRFILLGRTGAGKSSLINAMMGSYLAETSDVLTGTWAAEKYRYHDNSGEVVLEVIDTRGFGSLKEENPVSARKELAEVFRKFAPDAVLFMVRAKERSYLNRDLSLLQEMGDLFPEGIPVLALASQVDELEPSRYKDPSAYPSRKKENISQVINRLEEIMPDCLPVLEVMPVSSYIEWVKADGSAVDPGDLTAEEARELKIHFDGRFGIEKLTELLENNMDLRARIQFMMSSKMDHLIDDLCDLFINRFSVIAGAVGTTPVPTSDMFILTPLQIVMITLIAYLSGREISFSSSREFLLTAGGTGLVGKIFQQGAKLLNLVVPGTGSAVSGSIAASGTYAIGKAAKHYYLRDVSEEKLSEIIKQAREKYQADRGE